MEEDRKERNCTVAPTTGGVFYLFISYHLETTVDKIRRILEDGHREKMNTIPYPRVEGVAPTNGGVFYLFISYHLETTVDKIQRILEDGHREKMNTIPYPRVEGRPHPEQPETLGSY